jgi:serine/threonine protein kinase/WD40 repeat protein
MPELREQLVRALADRYVIEREIGAGGMATVYLARDVKHDRQVALKILDPELAAVMGVERFLAEIRVTAHLQHPNLLPLFDSGETANGSLFYVMPFVEGESLRHRLDREKQLPVDEAVRITTAIASALDYAHRHHVIHRDLKPENVLFQEGQPVVADFGIALAVSQAGGHRITQTGLSLGTPAYMSPEQATGDRAIDGRTDIYSLGAMLYEMLTGEPPHTGTTAQAIIARVLTEKPRAVRAVRPAVPAQVEAAVERALEKLPADRWETAGEFCDALTGKLTSGLPSHLDLERSRTRELRAPIPLTLAAIALVAATFAVVEWRVARRAEGARVIRFPVPITGGDRSGLSPVPAISPDGNTIAYSGFSPNGQAMVFLRTLSELNPRPLPGTESAVQPAFSPDGQWLAFFSLGRLRKIHIGTGVVRTLSPMNLPEGIDWGRDDRIVVAVDNRLVTVPASGGQPKPLTQLDTANGEQAQRGPHVLANGESVIFYSWRGSIEASRVGVASVQTGAASYLDVAGAPVGVLEGLLIYSIPSEALFAVPFDVRQLRVTGIPIRLSDSVPVVGNGLGRASVSRSGSLLYASGSALGDLVLVDPQKKDEIVLGVPRAYSFPRFSPDGKRVAVSIGSTGSIDVWIYDIASKTPTRITNQGSRNDRVEWTPDGKRILYSSVGRRNLTALWMQNTDLSGDAELLEGKIGEQVLEGVISPDGKTLIFRSTSAEHPHDIWYRKLGDTARTALASGPSSEYAPRFSPNGKWLAYGSNQDGSSQVYVQPFPPTGSRYQLTDEGGTTPVWSPDERRIYYLNGDKIFAATVQTTPSFAVVGRELVFSAQGYNLSSPVHAPYDVSRDGRHLLLLRPTRSDNGLVVVHNWKSELEKLKRGTTTR